MVGRSSPISDKELPLLTHPENFYGHFYLPKEKVERE